MIRTAANFTALAAAPGVNTPLLGVRYVVRAEESPAFRIGIAASKKIGGAVVRNRIRRRLKVIARDLAPQVRPGTDALIGVRAAAAVTQHAAVAARRERVAGRNAPTRSGRWSGSSARISGTPGPRGPSPWRTWDAARRSARQRASAAGRCSLALDCWPRPGAGAHLWNSL